MVGTDGRGTATINGATVEFVLTTNQHGALIRFDSNTTGSGSLDQQNLNDLVTLPSVISGPFAFSASGIDVRFMPLSIAGKFSSDGAGNVPSTNTIVDQNDNGVVKTADTSLHGFYSFDPTFPGSGRGTLTLASTATGQLQFAFYIADHKHLYLVEIDHNAHLGGEAFAAPTGNSFTTASLVGANYAFVAGGNSSTGAYASGGVFASNGSGSVTGGALDSNNAGTVVSNAALGTCAYTVDGTTGRIDLKLFAGSGACPGDTWLNRFRIRRVSDDARTCVDDRD